MTYRGHLRHSFGGVGRNIADCLSRLGCSPLFVSVVGNDWVGKLFRQQFTHMVRLEVNVILRQHDFVDCRS